MKTEEQLIRKGEEELEAAKKDITIELEYLPGGPVEYLQDFKVGDIVYIIEDGLVEAKMRLVEVKEENEGITNTLKLVLGREWPDLINVIADKGKNGYPIIRK